MRLERDAGLGERLDGALPSPEPPYGAKERIRRRLDGRLAAERSVAARAPIFAAALFAFAAIVVALLVARRHGTVITASTNHGSSVTLATARVVLRSDAELIVERDDPDGTVLRLVAGTIFAHVQKGTGRPFSVIAGNVRVRVVGTVFGVSRLPPESAAVEVIEGVVAVDAPEASRHVSAGERFPPGALEIRPTTSEWALLMGPSASVPSGEAPPVARSLPPAVDGGARTSADAGGSARGSAEPHARAHALPSASADPYTRARDLERSGATEDALAAYTAISRGKGPNAEDALFAVVRLCGQRGDNARVVSSAEEYRKAFPEGRYARAVDVHALNARLAQSDDEGVLREADMFLRKYSQDPRAFRFHLARATVLARRGDCSRARPDLEQVPDSDAKRAVTAACNGKQGR